MSAPQEHSDDRLSNAHRHVADGLRSMADVHAAVTHGHPVLGDVGDLLNDVRFSGVDVGRGNCTDRDADSGPNTGAERTVPVPDSAPAAVEDVRTRELAADELAAHAGLVDRLRAYELVQLATIGVSLAVSRRRSADRLAELFADEGDGAVPLEKHQKSSGAQPGSESDTCGAESGSGGVASGSAGGARAVASGAAASARNVPNAFTAAVGLPSLEGREKFLPRAEHLLEREHEAVLNVRLSARTGDSRRRLGQALTAYVGMPLLLRSILSGRVRYNRFDALTRRLKHLPLAHLQALDVFLAGLDPRYSLGQFLRHAVSFLAQFDTEPVLAARARSARDVWVEHLPDGLAVHCMQGPAAVIEARHAKTKATASAILKNQLKSMTVTRTDTTAQAGTGDLPDLGELTVTDERTLRQLMFDLLIGAQPQTQTALEPRIADDDSSERFRVDVVCPDDATILRKQAAVVVTVPMTTLLGLDDRPGTVEGHPLPADMARSIAGASKFWYRMLTDPATGQVLDDVAHRYEPDRATRLSVLGAWQTCTLPGCSRPARECEIDHGIPFDHDHPERGGRTEPANLHPLCTSHHQAKTEGRIRMRRTGYDRVEWVLPLGTTATTIAPRVDDGGVLTAACAPADTEERRAARAAIDERVVVDPVSNRRAASAVFEQAGREFLEEERAREELQAARKRERDPFLQEQRRLRQWVKQTRRDLHEREERVRARENATCRKERDVNRDQKLAALNLSVAEQKLVEAKRRVTFPETPLVRYKTVIPMRIEHVDLGDGMAGSLHTPVFFRATPVGGSDSSGEPQASRTSQTSAALGGPQEDRRGRHERPHRSRIDEQMATAVHDELAQRKVFIQWGHVAPELIRGPQSRPDQLPKQLPDQGTADEFDDDPPPF
ncbi:HNH endonuclease signature motif containing protein [Brevibacterium jeotgali]|uniref:HNH endonuclease n=1 Tax=Brevibacterium jeotgali TaxID=1262550 RepID=A0A2H1L593_9MICO|nr:HNH endonuclease signature motif containing protein [Brevibacterium jeotgali]TWC01490.1 hypothetical protein FB108_0136 [Brevibacterium jeotgali]SMY11905.1 hypothetical protein BJEO58_01497 [Brevibacterium jeotgali]